jgi:hypothetical protein
MKPEEAVDPAVRPSDLGEEPGPNLTPDIKTIPTASRNVRKAASCKPLEAQFHLKGFNYRQIAREGDVAIYEQTWRGCAEPSVCYEVVRVRRRDAYERFGQFYAATEFYPPSERWGADGFTLTDKDAAFAKLRVIEEKERSFK